MNRSIAGQARPTRLPWPLGGGPAAIPGRAGRAGRAATGSLLATLKDRRRLRILLVSALAAVPLLAGGWMWLRNSSLAAVRNVSVSGLHGPEAGEIESALVRAARAMSTLDVHPSALIAAVAPFRVVRAVHVSASFPHAMSIRVVEQLPVAAVQFGAVRTAVAADGAVLGPALLRRSLPLVSTGPATAPVPTGQYVRAGALSGELTVLGAEPAPFRKVVARVFSGSEGITVELRDGLLIYFGDATLPHAKWLALARVLLDQSSAGATYIDVRVPERPAAGFPGGVAPPGSATAQSGTSSGAGLAGATDPTTAAELKAGLAAALGSSSSSTSAAGTGAGTEAGSAATEAGSAATDAGSAGTQAGSTGSETAAPGAEVASPGPAEAQGDPTGGAG
jgi:cell division protein FtsQ